MTATDFALHVAASFVGMGVCGGCVGLADRWLERRTRRRARRHLDHLIATQRSAVRLPRTEIPVLEIADPDPGVPRAVGDDDHTRPTVKATALPRVRSER